MIMLVIVLLAFVLDGCINQDHWDSQKEYCSPDWSFRIGYNFSLS